MKNTGQDAAGINLLDWFAVSLGIDPSGHRLPSLVTNQTRRKLVGTLATNHGRTLDSLHENGSWRSNRLQYLASQTQSAC